MCCRAPASSTTFVGSPTTGKLLPSSRGQEAASASPEGSRDSRVSRVMFTQMAPFQVSSSYLFPFSTLTFDMEICLRVDIHSL